MDNVSKKSSNSSDQVSSAEDNDSNMADVTDNLSDLQLNGPDMLVDDYEQYNNDRQEVVNISPDEPTEEAEPDVRADDCTSFPTLCAHRSCCQAALLPAWRVTML